MRSKSLGSLFRTYTFLPPKWIYTLIRKAGCGKNLIPYLLGPWQAKSGISCFAPEPLESQPSTRPLKES